MGTKECIVIFKVINLGFDAGGTSVKYIGFSSEELKKLVGNNYLIDHRSVQYERNGDHLIISAAAYLEESSSQIT